MDISKEKYVFISYSSQNREHAEAVRNLFVSKNILCWMAPHDIPAGYKYAGVINDAVENCSCLLLLLTEDAQSSEFVNREVETAVSNRKTIITMQLEDIKLNSDFKFYVKCGQIVPVREITEESPDMKKIIDSVMIFTETEAIDKDTPEEPEKTEAPPEDDEFVKSESKKTVQTEDNADEDYEWLRKSRIKQIKEDAHNDSIWSQYSYDCGDEFDEEENITLFDSIKVIFGSIVDFLEAITEFVVDNFSIVIISVLFCLLSFFMLGHTMTDITKMVETVGVFIYYEVFRIEPSFDEEAFAIAVGLFASVHGLLLALGAGFVLANDFDYNPVVKRLFAVAMIALTLGNFSLADIGGSMKQCTSYVNVYFEADPEGACISVSRDDIPSSLWGDRFYYGFLQINSTHEKWDRYVQDWGIPEGTQTVYIPIENLRNCYISGE